MYITETIKTKLESSEILSLSNARHRKGITQAELAELAGIDVSYLSKIENGACLQIKKTLWDKLFELIDNFQEIEKFKLNNLNRNLIEYTQKLEKRIEELEKKENK